MEKITGMQNEEIEVNIEELENKQVPQSTAGFLE